MYLNLAAKMSNNSPGVLLQAAALSFSAELLSVLARAGDSSLSVISLSLPGKDQRKCQSRKDV